ncbi:hypothetical protein [Xanthobacter dioxanivorans]|nr:hypothetical protein [Xanthobacter dioxanivorans]
MNARLKILVSLSTIVFIGIGIVHSAYANEYKPSGPVIGFSE